ncbi:MAG TPA: DUF2922 domain-containing protein [Firmicutes bacterium]|nr:DUF2922 domain-containing protein [Bacillota bacterium]
MAQSLQMIFQNEEGRNVNISIADARVDLEPLDVETAMNDIVSGNLFITNGGEIIKPVRGQLVSRYVQTIVEF